MATIDRYKIVLDVQGQQAVDNLKNSLGGLTGAIAGISFTALITSAFRMADAFNDVAQASGLAVGEVTALANAIKEAGGEYADVGKLVARFYNVLEEGAADSSSKSADALAKVGISLKELRTLSEGQLLGRAIEELARMEAGAARTALGVELFGKSFAMIDPKVLEQVLKTQDITALQEEMQKASEVVGNLEASFFELQKAIVKVLTPLIGETNNFKLSAEQAEKVVKVLGATLLTLFSAKLIAGIAGAVTAIVTLTKALAGTALVANLLGKNPIIKILGGLAVAAGVGAAAWAVYDDELKDVTKSADDLENSLKKFGDLSTGQGGAFKDATGITEKQAQAMAQAALAAKQVTDQLIRQNAAANRMQQLRIDLIGKEEDYNRLLLDNKQIQEDTALAVADLEAKITTERAKGRDTNQQVIDQLRQQIIEKQKQSEEAQKLNQLEFDRNRQLEIQKLNLRDIQSFTQSFYSALLMEEEARLNVLRAIGKINSQQATEQRTINTENLNSQRTLTDLQLRLDAAREAGRTKEVDDLQRLIGLETDRNAMAVKALNDQIAARKLLNESTIAGTIDALNNIQQQFTPYKMAQDAIMMGWNKIGSAVDEFVQTGKFKFSDFARSVLRDLTAMILKAQIFAGIKATLGFFGITLPGLAEGGPTKQGQPYIVGEKGPELFVPKEPGTVIPNKALTSAAPNIKANGNVMNAPITNNYITNNISALDAKSVAQLFAENRKTLLGTVRMAEKELPYGNR